MEENNLPGYSLHSG